MRLANHLQEGFFNLLTSKLRSLLALLGILVGTASVVAMVLGGELATHEALKQFKTLGTDLLAITLSDDMSDDPHSTVHENLTLLQAETIKTAHPSILDAAPYTQVYSPIQWNGHDLNGSVLGVTQAFARIVHIELQKGRFVSSLDGHAYFCVIGSAINNEIKRQTFNDAIGQQIQVGKSIFTVIGIAAPWPENSFVYTNIDSAILIPIRTSMDLSKYANITNIILQLSPDANIDAIQQQLTRYVNQTIANKRIFFRSAKELIHRMAKQSQIFTVFLGLIGSISLLVGGIGVMNIMLVSVVERRREIGIRLAVGATRADIRTLFLIEAVMLSLIGGTLGVILGIMIAYVMAFIWHWEFAFFFLPPVIGFSVSVATGVFFGFYPAYKASQLNPIDALRA